MGQSKVKILIIDSVTTKGVEFATATLTAIGKSEIYRYGVADSTGKAEISNVAFGKYILKIDHLNYIFVSKEITVNSKEVNVGKILIKEKLISMSSVTVTAMANPIVVKKDTIEFTASAFPVAEGDVLEQLLKKMPGLEMDSKGKFTYNGKAISKIMVDGKDFFANDSRVVTSNLPARIIDKVKVIDRKSEQSRFTGIDDGNSETVMDVTVKDGFNKGVFGNATAGYGTQDTYTGNIFAAKFNKKTNFGIVANSSNVSSGIVMVSESGGNMSMMMGGMGKSTTNIYGINGNTELDSGKVKIGGSYNFFENSSVTETKKLRQTFMEDTSYIYNQSANGISDNKSNKFGVTLEWSPSKKLKFMLRPNFDISNNTSSNRTEYTTAGASGVPVNEGVSNNYSLGNTKNLNTSLLIMYSFDKKRRTLSINTGFGLSDGNNDGFNQSKTTKYENNTENTDSVKQKSNTLSNNYSYNLRVSYTEPISTKFTMELAYNLRYGYRISDKNTFNWNAASETYDLKDDVYSNNFKDVSVSQSMDMNLQRTEKKYSYSAGFSVQPTYTKSIGTGRNYTNSVINYAPSLTLQITLNKSTYLRANYRGSSSQPNISQLQPVPDNTNPLYIRIGNPGLLPGFRSSVDIGFSTGNREKSRAFDLSVNGNYSTNSFSNISAYGNGGVQYSVPVNTDPIYSGSVRVMYNTPLITKKLFLSYMNSVNFNNNMSYTAKIEADPQADPRDVTIANFKSITANTTNTLSVNNQINLSFRFKKAEIYAGANLSYRNTWYSIANKSKPEIWNMGANVAAQFQLPFDFRVNSSMAFNVSKGYGGERDKPYSILNADVNKGLLKNKLNLKLIIYDILNQAKGINRVTTENYIEDTQFVIQKQYFLLSLTYKFGMFPGGGRGARGFGGVINTGNEVIIMR